MPRRPFSAVLLQLPVQSHDYAYSQENLPLAVALVAAAGRRAHPDAEIVLAPPALVDRGGDAALLEHLVSARPEVVGFGCAVWNVERSLDLARRLKKRSPRTIVVLGGPEVSPDNAFLRRRGGFDAAVVGEGEETFPDLLAAVRAGTGLERVPGLLLPRARGRWRETAPRPPHEPVDDLPSAYLSGAAGPSPARSLALESVRGCPQRCAYCRYHKSFPRLRAFELTRVEAELRWALARGVEEVTFVDPCFARRPRLAELLALLRRLGAGALRVRCELNAEDVSMDLARDLARAGVVDVEVGLQSTNPAALRLAQRAFRPQRFLTGVRALRAEGIHVVLDTMVGLPGDTLDDYRRTLDFATRPGLCDELKAYPLCVLPGTVFRQRAQELGLRFQAEPPYHVLETGQMAPEEIYRALCLAEDATGQDLFPVEVPHRTRERLRVRPGEPLGTLRPQDVGQALRVDLEDRRWPERLDELRRCLARALAENPSTLVSYFLPARPFPTASQVQALRTLVPRPEHVLDRDWFAVHNPRRSVQVFVRVPGATALLPAPAEGPVGPLQRACWLALDKPLPEAGEDALIDRLASAIDDPEVWFRVGSAG